MQSGKPPARRPRLYKIEAVPLNVRLRYASPDLPVQELFPMTAKQIAEASGLDPELVRRRLVNQYVRNWRTLTRSPAAGRQAAVNRQRKVLLAASMTDADEREREAARIREISKGHRSL